MTKRFDINLVREIIEAEGYRLISTHYVNSATKIDLLCPKGHPWSATLNNFRSQGQRCFQCLGRKFYDLDIVKKLLSEESYQLITPVYENMHQKLELVCPKGHSYFTSLTNYVCNGCRCFTCTGIKRYTLEEISNILKKEGYLLISQVYKNAQEKLDVICPNGHEIAINMNGFLSAEARCQHCADNRPHSIESIRTFVENKGYILVSETYDPQKKIELICPNGHAYNTSTFYNFKKGRRCPECIDAGWSKSEQEVLDWIKQFYPNANKNQIRFDPTNRKKYLELDIHIKEINLGIEYNGLIWHCDKYKKNDFHINKMKLANSLGIRVINIFGDEWRDRQDQIKNYLMSVIGKNPINVGARKTDLRVVAKKEAQLFLDENHIQGHARLSIAFGLYHNNDLVAIMTGDKHHRQDQEDIFVLNRLAFKSGISVQGGSSKLLKALVAYAKESGYAKLISWSDNRWSEGKVYEKMGFTLEEEMKPDYSYVKRENRISKQSCQKKNLIKRGAVGGMERTEKELALSLKLFRVYDCGKKRWVMDLK